MDFEFNAWAELIYVLLFYIIFKRKLVDKFIINITLISFLLSDVLLILSSWIIVLISNDETTASTFIIWFSIIIKLVLTFILLLIMNHFNISTYIKKQNSIYMNILLGYSYLAIFFLGVSVQYFRAYSHLIDGIIIFVTLQSLFMIFMFILEQKEQTRNYKNNLVKEQTKNLKLYTDQLEHDQLKLRRFKHDYKNLLHSLEIDIHNHNYDNLSNSLNEMNDYSDEYLNTISTELYRDLGNIKIPYLKSLFISKLSTITTDKINCKFECKYNIDKIPMNQFDFIRIIGITIDNAIESTESIKNGVINISLVRDGENLIYIIQNTSYSKDSISKMIQPGFTTKDSHEGLGMSNIKEINKNYPNLLVQHSNKNNMFTTQITIIGAQKK